MSDVPEVEWVLDELSSVVDIIANTYTLQNGGMVEVKRVDRDNAETYLEGKTVDQSSPIRTRTGELESAVYVGVGQASGQTSAIGTSYDHRIETRLGVRCEGLHYNEYGHVDPDGENGVPFTSGFVRRVKRQLLHHRTFPADVGREDVQYTDIRVENEAPQSTTHADYYRTDFDVVFHGYETLP